MMQSTRTLGTVALFAAFSALASAQPVTLFYDGFETGTLAGAPDLAIWNNTVGTIASPPVDPALIATVQATGSYTSGPVTAPVVNHVNPFRGSQFAFIPPIATGVPLASRPRYRGNLTSVINTSTDNRVLYGEYWVFDPLNAPTSGNARMQVNLLDYVTNFNPATGLSNTAAWGHWNSVSAVWPLQNFGLGVGATGTQVATSYNVRHVGGLSLSGYVIIGLDDPITPENERIARTLGWRRLGVSYFNGEFRAYVDGQLAFFAVTGRAPTFDMITLGSNESSPIPHWIDELSVRSFAPGSINVEPRFNLFVGDTALIPVKIEAIDAAGTVVETWTTQFVGSLGDITVEPTMLTAGQTYSFRITIPRFLTKRVRNQVWTGNGLYMLPSMVNGNATFPNDDEVGPSDFSDVLAGFGSEPGSPGYDDNPLRDMNGDGEIGPADFSVVLASFGQEGEG